MYFSDNVGSPGPLLFTIDTAGRNQQRVPTPSFASYLAWSPLVVVSEPRRSQLMDGTDTRVMIRHERASGYRPDQSTTCRRAPAIDRRGADPQAPGDRAGAPKIDLARLRSGNLDDVSIEDLVALLNLLDRHVAVTISPAVAEEPNSPHGKDCRHHGRRSDARMGEAAGRFRHKSRPLPLRRAEARVNANRLCRYGLLGSLSSTPKMPFITIRSQPPSNLAIIV